MNAQERLLYKAVNHIKSLADKYDDNFIEGLVDLCVQFYKWGGINRHFVNEFINPNSFNQRIAEMLFARKLSISNLCFTINPDGPDFFLHDYNLWIELVCPKPTRLPAEYCYTDTPDGFSYEVPYHAISLSWTNALANKINGLSHYKNDINPKVSDEQGYIIAVNCSQLGTDPTITGDSQLPYPVELGYAKGPFTVVFEGDPSIPPKWFIPRRENIYNNNGASVNSNIFLTAQNAGLSAIIGTDSGLRHMLSTEEESCVMAHNPHATNPTSYGIINGCEEYISEDDGAKVIRIDPRTHKTPP